MWKECRFGINDKQILAAMADPRIDYIIPFHSSGWTKEDMRLMPTLEKYTDYQNYQTEKDLDTGAKTKKNGGNNIAPVGAKDEYGNGYWDFNKSGKENAETYLDICYKNKLIPIFSQFLDKDENGHYHLKADGSTDGYWKMLIDFKMYENDGDGSTGVVKGSPQLAVTPNVNMAEAYRILSEYKLEREQPGAKTGLNTAPAVMKDNNSLPVAQPVVERFTAEMQDREAQNAAEREARMAMLGRRGMATAGFGDMTLGNTESNAEEVQQAKQNVAAIDPDTGETVRYSLPSDAEIDQYFDDYIENLSAEELDELAKELFGVSLNTPSRANNNELNVEAANEDVDGINAEIVNEGTNDLPANIHELYKDAVANGDFGTAREIIDKIAKAAGYTVRGTHRTNAEFTVFDRSAQTGKNGKTLGDGFYIASGEGTEYDSDIYGKNRMLIYAKPGNVFNIQEGGLSEEQAKQVYAEYFAPFHPNANDVNDDSNPYTTHVIAQLQKSYKVMDYIKEAADNANVTTDAIFKELGYNSIKDGPQYVVFDPEQIKSADPITYDDGGNEIQSSERFTSNPDIRYSLPSDAPYLSAVDHGDMETAQEMVDQRAEESFKDSKIRDDTGRLIPVYHGSAENFTVFDPSKSRANMDIQGSFFSPWELDASGYGDNVRRFYLDIKNPASEAQGYAALRRFQGQNEAGKKAREYLISQGYDGVNNGDMEYIAFYPEQIKSADAVTYDDNGDVITLGERFNTSESDVRYSLPSPQYMEQQIRDRLANGMSTGGNNNLPGMPIEENGSAQRQFGYETAQESDALHDDVKDYLYTHSSYTPETNREQIDRAVDWVKSHANENDTDGFFGAMQEAQSAGFNSLSADGQARMLTLMSMAALKGEQSGDHSAELLLSDMYNKQRTEVGRALQAGKIFRLMTPIGRKETLNRMADQINEEYGRLGNERRVRLSDWTLEAAAVAETEEDFERVRKAATKELAEQMPANWKEKLTAWRMLSMLGNPRTHVRNLVGNALFMPAVTLKNKIGATLESAFVKDGERTKTIGLASKEARSFAKADAKAMEDVLRGTAKYSEGGQVQQERKMFGQGKGIVSRTVGRAMQALVDLNGNALEAEDWIFLKQHYQNALAGYMTANKLTEADMKGDTLEKAREYAVQEAQKATYRDANELATWLNNVKNPVAKFVVNAVLPFKKTPANILKRGVEYSPVGIIKSLTADAYHLKQWNDYQNGKLSTLPEKAISPTQYIDRISAGLSGTLVLAAGALLSSLGMVRAGLDDDDDEFDKLRGSQEYSIEIGGISFTADWAAPMSMPFFVGATIMDEIRKGQDGEAFSVGDVLDSILGISEPVFNLSMLDGVNSLLNTSQYEDTNNITQIGEKVAVNYLTSYVPTIMGQFARTIDTTRRKNYVESGADLPVFRSALEQVENKIPFLSQTNIPYRNVWGEADVSPQGWAAIENFISPGYGNTITDDPVTNELQRIYEATGDKNMIPKAASKTVSIGGQTVRLNAEQYDQYVVDRGQTAKQCLTDLMESPVWQICDDGTRAMMVTDAWTYANQIARNRLDQNGKLDSWVASAEHNGNFVDVVMDRAAESNRKDYIAGYGLTMAEALNYNDGEMYDLSLTALDEAEATEAEIRAPLRDYFKPLYQQAFKENDRNTMLEIEDKLVDAGVGFKASTFEGWIPSEEDEEKETDTRWLNNDLRSDMDNSMMPIYQAAMASGDTAKMEQIERMLLNSGLGYTEKDFEAWKQR